MKAFRRKVFFVVLMIFAAAHGNGQTMTRYEETCAHRFFDFCDYLTTPPDIVIDRRSYAEGQKPDEIVMQRERAEDTAKIKTAVLRYTVIPEPTNTTDSLHFTQDELSDREYRKLETAFATIEHFLDTFYKTRASALNLVPLRLHDDARVRSQIGRAQFSSTFLLCRGDEILAVLLFTPRDRMTAASPPRIRGWSVDFRHGRMIFHNIAGSNEAVALSR